MTQLRYPGKVLRTAEVGVTHSPGLEYSLLMHSRETTPPAPTIGHVIEGPWGAIGVSTGMEQDGLMPLNPPAPAMLAVDTERSAHRFPPLRLLVVSKEEADTLDTASLEAVVHIGQPSTTRRSVRGRTDPDAVYALTGALRRELPERLMSSWESERYATDEAVANAVHRYRVLWRILCVGGITLAALGHNGLGVGLVTTTGFTLDFTLGIQMQRLLAQRQAETQRTQPMADQAAALARWVTYAVYCHYLPYHRFGSEPQTEPSQG